LDPRGTAKGDESGADKISLTENAGTGTFVDLAKAPALERSCPHETLGLGQEKPSFDRARDSHRSGCDRVGHHRTPRANARGLLGRNRDAGTLWPERQPVK